MLEHIRRGIDGSFWIPRKHQETEAYLDDLYTRVEPLKWMPRHAQLITQYTNIYCGQVGYIIGKGPSLDFLTLAMLMNFQGPILCLNESIHKVLTTGVSKQRLYGVQLDSQLQETCSPGPDVPIFLSTNCANLYMTGHKPVVIDPNQLLLDGNCLSGQYAIKLLRTMGCVGACLVAFDGCLKQNYGYARCIGYPSSKGGVPTRFREHKAMLREAAGKSFPLQWLTPKEGGKYDHVLPLS